MPAIEVRKVPLHSVSDASELAALIDEGVLEADRVVAVIGKTEGNGGVNDYTRIIADRAFREVLVAKGAPEDQVRQIPIVWSGGTDGVITSLERLADAVFGGGDTAGTRVVPDPS